MPHEFYFVMWIAIAYVVARIVNNYVSVRTILGPGV